MKSTKLIGLLIACLLLTNCGEQLSIKFGSGGGFTGEVNEFIIDSNRELYSNKPLTDKKEKLGGISKKEVKSIIEMVNKSNLMEEEYNTPGNFYKYIELTKGSTSKKFAWSDDQQNEATAKLQTLYNLLTKIVEEK